MESRYKSLTVIRLLYQITFHYIKSTAKIHLLALCICPFLAAQATTVHLKDYSTPRSDVSDILQKLVNTYDTIYIDKGTWKVHTTILLRSNVHIIGTNAKKSVFTADLSVLNKGLYMFATQKADPYSLKKPAKEEINYQNITFENLTFSFAKGKMDAQTVKNHWYYTIMLTNAQGCHFRQCRFLDTMTQGVNNGCCCITMVYCKDCDISHCITQNTSLAYARYCRDITFSQNTGTNSVGTWIESHGGSNIKVLDNHLSEVFWKVSCIGINSTNSTVSNNTVIANKNTNISCITLGHDVTDCEADGSIAVNNNITTTNTIGFILQNGHNVTFKDNIISFRGANDKSLTEGGIVASGKAKNMYDIHIEGNHITNTGRTSACIMYRGTGDLDITGNMLSGYQGIRLYNTDIKHAVVSGNTISGTGTWSLATTGTKRLTITNNTMSDGVISNATKTEMGSNNIANAHAKNYFPKGGNVDIKQ